MSPFANVVRILGLSPETDHLEKIAGSTVDSRGQIYLVDGRSTTVHFFDSTGTTTGVCVPDVQDFRAGLFDTALSVSDSGEILLCVDDIGGSGRFVEFSASGEQINSLKLKLNTDCLHYQPGTNKRLAITYDSAVLLDSSETVIREISRRPDGNWLMRPARACFAADGSLFSA